MPTVGSRAERVVLETRTCRFCGELFEITKDQASIAREHGHQLPTKCHECREAKRNAERAVEQIQCADCRLFFVFEPGERRYYEAEGWPPPKRCPECRRKSKARVPR
jgi:hypothetical protein